MHTTLAWGETRIRGVLCGGVQCTMHRWCFGFRGSLDRVSRRSIACGIMQVFIISQTGLPRMGALHRCLFRCCGCFHCCVYCAGVVTGMHDAAMHVLRHCQKSGFCTRAPAAAQGSARERQARVLQGSHRLISHRLIGVPGLGCSCPSHMWPQPSAALCHTSIL